MCRSAVPIPADVPPAAARDALRVTSASYWRTLEQVVYGTDVPALHQAEPVLNGGPLVHADTRIPVDVTRSFIEEFM